MSKKFEDHYFFRFVPKTLQKIHTVSSSSYFLFHRDLKLT
jgi:hypothetical protein